MIKRTFSQWTEHIMHLLILAGTFLLPFGLLVGFITALIFIVWLADPRWRSKGEALRTSPLSWIFISYFLFHALNLIWANNISEAWATTQVKLVFFLLPPVFTFLKVDTKFTQWVLAVFIAGLL